MNPDENNKVCLKWRVMSAFDIWKHNRIKMNSAAVQY